MASPDQFFLDILKVLIGTFSGAFLAFFANWLLRQSQREDDQIAAGNLAISVMGRMVNAFLIYKKGVIEIRTQTMSANPNLPGWMQMLPILHEFDESLVIDMQSLTFLFRPGSVDVMNHILIAQGKYRNLVYLHKQHFKDMQELQRILSELQGDDQYGPINWNFTVKKIPPHLAARIESVSTALQQSLNEDENTMIEALKALEKTLASNLGKDRTIRISLPPQLISTKLVDEPTQPS
ncbi:hypothetical protein ACO0K9_26850 [Undibacterium sp. Ji50W]|uniref:hypothetical protein n=1 Tax=Undibacterium sp. Ji50W TaxID=3413041 RepID=UPI003BF25397